MFVSGRTRRTRPADTHQGSVLLGCVRRGVFVEFFVAKSRGLVVAPGLLGFASDITFDQGYVCGVALCLGHASEWGSPLPWFQGLGGICWQMDCWIVALRGLTQRPRVLLRGRN